MIVTIPVNYEGLKDMTQTTLFNLSGRQYSITLRKSTISDKCYITIEVDKVVLCENRVCTVMEILTRGTVDISEYPFWIYFAYATEEQDKNFDYNELGKTLFLVCWDGDLGDFDV